MEFLNNGLKKYEGRYLSISSWPDIAEFESPEVENLSLSLRAKLLYGKHLFEDLVEEGHFGNPFQIALTLNACDRKNVLIFHNDSIDLENCVTADDGLDYNNQLVANDELETDAMQQEKTFSKTLYDKLSQWLS